MDRIQQNLTPLTRLSLSQYNSIRSQICTNRLHFCCIAFWHFFIFVFTFHFFSMSNADSNHSVLKNIASIVNWVHNKELFGFFFYEHAFFILNVKITNASFSRDHTSFDVKPSTKSRRKLSLVNRPEHSAHGAKGIRQHHRRDEEKILYHKRAGIKLE